MVGQTVAFHGSGFAPRRTYDVAVDGIDFGVSTTNALGGFQNSFSPGGLGAGYTQLFEVLTVTDGTVSANAKFTVTRPAGARFLATRGNPRTLRAPFEVWGFAPDGSHHSVFVHYVSPSGRARTTVGLGVTRGQCGYLRTGGRRLFPFSPARGRWTLQVDTQRTYARSPSGPVARISVRIS